MIKIKLTYSLRHSKDQEVFSSLPETRYTCYVSTGEGNFMLLVEVITNQFVETRKKFIY